MRAGAKDVSTKAIAYAEKNVAASLDYAQQLLHAKDLGDVMRLPGEDRAVADEVAGRADQRNSGQNHEPRCHGRRQAQELTDPRALRHAISD